MPETEYELISKEWLQTELRSISASSSLRDAKDLIILDCRSSHEFSECHIRSAVNFSIPSIMLRRLAAGKIDLLSTIKSPELKERINNGYKVSLFVLYNDVGAGQHHSHHHENSSVTGQSSAMDVNSTSTTSSGGGPMMGISPDTTINVLHKRLKQDGCRVVSLQGESKYMYVVLIGLNLGKMHLIFGGVFLLPKNHWSAVRKGSLTSYLNTRQTHNSIGTVEPYQNCLFMKFF